MIGRAGQVVEPCDVAMLALREGGEAQQIRRGVGGGNGSLAPPRDGCDVVAAGVDVTFTTLEM